MTTPRRSDAGFVLVLVLWVLAILAILAAGIAVTSRSAVEIARNRMALAHARAAADAGTYLAIDHLLDPDASGRWRADGTMRTLHFDGCLVTVLITDEGGKIDLNQASGDFIDNLLAELGIPNRTQILARILARRQSFPAATASAAGRLFLGADQRVFDRNLLPFATVSDLRLFTPLSRAAYDRIRPYVTVYSESPTVDPRTAPRAVLLAVPNVSPQDVAFLMTARAEGRSSDLPELSGAERYVATREIRAVTIVARAATPSGAVFTRDVVVILSPTTPSQPYTIEQWGQALAG